MRLNVDLPDRLLSSRFASSHVRSLPSLPTLSSTPKPLPLGLRADHSLSVDEVDMLSRIERYDLWFVEERLRRKAVLPVARLPAALLEMKRFLALKALGFTEMELVDDDADEVWHAFILFTEHYRVFCRDVVGRFLDHTPFTSRSPGNPWGKAHFAQAYATVFGTRPPHLGPLPSLVPTRPSTVSPSQWAAHVGRRWSRPLPRRQR